MKIRWRAKEKRGKPASRLGPVSVVEYLDGGVEADSVLEVYLAFGMVPEVDGLGDKGVVLGLEEVFEEVLRHLVGELFALVSNEFQWQTVPADPTI